MVEREKEKEKKLQKKLILGFHRLKDQNVIIINNVEIVLDKTDLTSKTKT